MLKYHALNWIHVLEFSFEYVWLVFWDPVFATTLLVCTLSQLLFPVCLWTCWCVMTDIDMTHERAACLCVARMNNGVLIWVDASLPALGAHLCIFLHEYLPEWNHCARVKCIQLKAEERKSQFQSTPAHGFIVIPRRIQNATCQGRWFEKINIYSYIFFLLKIHFCPVGNS